MGQQKHEFAVLGYAPDDGAEFVVQIRPGGIFDDLVFMHVAMRRPQVVGCVRTVPGAVFRQMAFQRVVSESHDPLAWCRACFEHQNAALGSLPGAEAPMKSRASA